MSITHLYRRLDALFSVNFGTALVLVVGTIKEVYPATPVTGGTQQSIRLTGENGQLVDLILYEQPMAIRQTDTGSVIRISAGPNAKRPIVWERAKATNPTLKAGVVIARRHARIEIIRPGHEQAAGIVGDGFTVADPVAAPSAAPISGPTPGAPTNGPEVAAPRTAGAPASAPGPDTRDVTRRIAECVRAARAELGADADPGDVRAAADLLYGELYRAPGASRRVA